MSVAVRGRWAVGVAYEMFQGREEGDGSKASAVSDPGDDGKTVLAICRVAMAGAPHAGGRA